MRNSRKRGLWKKVIALLLVGCVWGSQPVTADAVRDISDIEEDQNELQEQLDSLDSELVSVVSEISDLQTQISDTEDQIEETKQELVYAQEAVDKQYAAMKIRIQYMYENSDQSILTVLLESGSISDFLNRVEYMNSVYSYDRDTLDNYQATVQEMEELKLALEESQEELKTAEASLESRQSQLDQLITEKSGELDDISTELAEAKAYVARQEELRRQQEAAEAAAAAAAAQAAAQQAAAAAAQQNQSSAATGGSSSGGDTGSSGGSTGSGTSLNPTPTTGVSGSAIVSYAMQYVGYPYTWGGTDPVNGGADCSGFIYYVLKHFGINYGRLTSAGWRSVGQEVSYDNIQPGDIVCYQGHVAIYAGGGVIVEAQSTSAGITCNRSVNCHNIITIRRVI